MSYGQKWYSYLVPGSGPCLKDAFPDLYNKRVVCKTTPKGRLFTAFDTYMDLWEHYKSLPDKTFHEVILGQFNQKAHFDIDMPASACGSDVDKQFVLESVVQGILTVFKKSFEVTLSLEQDVLVYSSHGDGKISFHIVVDHYCHVSNDETKRICELVVEEISSGVSKFLDKGVYNANQCFRMVLSHKEESTRTKIFEKQWVFNGATITYAPSVEHFLGDEKFSEIEEMEHFKASLVSETSDCKTLPVIAEPKPKFESTNLTFEMTHLLKLLNNFDANHQVVKQEGSILQLRSLRPWNCQICNRTHEHENAFLTVGKTGTVHFHCRRSNDKRAIGRMTVDLQDVKKFEVPEFECEILENLLPYETILAKLQEMTGEKPRLKEKGKFDWKAALLSGESAKKPAVRKFDPFACLSK